MYEPVTPEGKRLLEQVNEILEARDKLKAALVSMVYVHPCQCPEMPSDVKCARCRGVEALGFDPAEIS